MIYARSTSVKDHSPVRSIALRAASLVLVLTSCMAVCHAQTTGTAADSTVRGSMGWSPFTSADQHTLHLSEVQMAKLKEMDAGFAADYKAMGIEPWRDERFPELNRKRNTAIRGILDDAQYKNWSDPATPVPAEAPSIFPDSSGTPDH